MTGVLVATAAAYGVFLLYSSIVLERTDSATRRDRARRRAELLRRRTAAWLAQAGLNEVRPRDLAVAALALFTAGALIATSLFGGLLPAVVAGLLAACFPVELARQRRRARRQTAQEAWPRLIEEIRLLTGSIGRSIPQALLEAGRSAPDELQPAFEAAQREWTISTDFRRAVTVLEDRLGDATADTTCETLLVAHELGGADLDRRLADLAADRRADLHYRKDARARQAGVRFARRFVLIVPLGMALAGLSVGDRRDAYATARGQLAVVAALAMIAGCWMWAGRLMRLPEEQRVFRPR